MLHENAETTHYSSSMKVVALPHDVVRCTKFLDKVVQGSSETTLVTLALRCASLSQTGAAGIGTVTSVLRVLTQTKGCEHETVCLHVWQVVLIYPSTAAEE